MEATNNSKGPQGLHTLDGIVYVRPGETKTVRLNQTLASHAKALDFFKLKGEPENDELGQAESPAPVAVDGEADKLKAENKRLLKVIADHETEIAKLKAAKPDEAPKTATEVLAMASNPDVQFMTFKSAATKLLGDKTPAKKDEIVAALEDLATQP